MERIATIFGIASAAWVSGYQASMSACAMPAIALAPPNLGPRQWRKVYDVGIRSAVPVAMLSAALFGYAAFSKSRAPEPMSTLERNQIYLLSFAAVSAAFIGPFTVMTMVSTNAALDAKLAAASTLSASVKGDSEVTALVYKWATLNGIRCLFPLAAAVAGLWAVVS